ncbi:rod shape-determining protein MreD [Lacticaseibacillus hulanensis]|uniref:rod shape-determining protein MreD n=1 Tax=Lacticaseibacillus hulanensis TaxID=2493111 RepID=UPI000FDC9476|nr:rod shape-determining protein MreD [Lacticaseibacillus hulanensis]
MMNDKPYTRHWVAAVFLFVALLLDGTMTQVLATWSTSPAGPGVPQIMLMVLVFIALLVPEENWVVAMAIVAGVLMDMFYTGVIGVDALILPLITYLVRSLRPYVAHSGVVAWGIFIIAMAVRMYAEYLLLHFMGQTVVTTKLLITQHLAPSLTVNIIIFMIIYFPCTRLLVKLTQR